MRGEVQHLGLSIGKFERYEMRLQKEIAIKSFTIKTRPLSLRRVAVGWVALVAAATTFISVPSAAEAQTATLPGDIVFVIDESGSMRNEQSAIQSSVPALASAVVAGGVDGNFGLIGYGSSNPTPVVEQTVTSDLGAFTSAIGGLTASGATEPGYDGIVLATSTAVAPRPSAGLCVVVVTDEPSNGDTATEADALAAANAAGATVFGVLSQDAATLGSYTNIISSTGGQIFDFAALSSDPTAIANTVGSACAEAIINQGGGEGCTPGYWKQKHHMDSWNGYTPEDSFSDIFVDGPDMTLGETLKKGGGKFTALNRHTVAALLNASNNDVSYDYSTSEIISLVQQAYDSGDWSTAKNDLESANESGCPLS